MCAAAHAQVHHLDDPDLIVGGEAAIIPVHVVVEARLSGAATEGVVRIQSGPYEWIDVAVTSANWSTLRATGYFDSQAATDHTWTTLQVFATIDAGAVEIRGALAAFDDP